MGLLACIQMASGPNVQANLQEVEKLLAQSVDAGAQLVVLPENVAMMGLKESDKLSVMEAEGSGPIQDCLMEMASRYRVWIVGGTIPLKCEDERRIRASTLVYNADSQLVARYDKIHLFDVDLPDQESYHESSTIQQGNDVVVIDTPVGRMGLAICYDIRFPEMFRLQLNQGMEILALPSAFTALTGKAHWQTLLAARAIENQCYVAASAQDGCHVNGRETYGHSMIINPWGTVLDSLPSGSGFVLAEIDHAELESIRRTFPAIQHRRLN